MSSVSFRVEYTTFLPREGQAPKVYAYGDSEEEFTVQFIDSDKRICLKQCILKTNGVVTGDRQYYTNWVINILDKNGVLRFTDTFNPSGQVVFIKCDSYALGDNISWIPYFEEFRRRHNCTVICSTFFNELFEREYPHLLFVKPNTRIGNVYAQFYVGATTDINEKYSPGIYNNKPLQQTATDILGFNFVEMVPRVSEPTLKLSFSDGSSKGYVCLSEFASAENKMWQYPNGWQMIVDKINSLGYKVVVISKEPTKLKNIIDLTGNHSLQDRINQISGAKLFLGVSSGLSWLAWAVGTHVVMISDISPDWHEFQTGITRFSANENNIVDYEQKGVTSCEKVIEKLNLLLG